MAPATARALRAVALEDDVAHLAGEAAAAGEQPVADDHARAHALVDAQVQQRIGRLRRVEFHLAQRRDIGFVLDEQRHAAEARARELLAEQRAHRHVAPAEVGSEAQHRVGLVDATGQAHADADDLVANGIELRAQLQQRRGQAADARLGAAARAVVGDDGGEHPAGERHRHHAHRLDADLGAQQQQARVVDEQRGGTATEFSGGHDLALDQPAFVDQLAHQHAHGRLGQSDGGGEVGARQPRVGAHAPHEGHAVDNLQQLLASRGFGWQDVSPDVEVFASMGRMLVRSSNELKAVETPSVYKWPKFKMRACANRAASIGARRAFHVCAAASHCAAGDKG